MAFVLNDFWGTPSWQYTARFTEPWAKHTNARANVVDELTAFAIFIVSWGLHAALVYRIYRQYHRLNVKLRYHSSGFTFPSKTTTAPSATGNLRYLVIASLVIFGLYSIGGLLLCVNIILGFAMSFQRLRIVQGQPELYQYMGTAYNATCVELDIEAPLNGAPNSTLTGLTGQETCVWMAWDPPENLQWIAIVVGLVMQLVVYLVDCLLVYRCYQLFRHRRIVWIVALALLLFSVVESISTLVYDFIGPQAYCSGLPESWCENRSILPSQLFRSFVDPARAILPAISCCLSVLVNIYVSTAIVIHILKTTKKVNKLMSSVSSSGLFKEMTTCEVGRQKPTSTVIPLIVETALPAAVSGLLVFLLTIPFVAKNEKWVVRQDTIPGLKYNLRMLWIACTAIAPQGVLSRVLDQRLLAVMWSSASTTQMGGEGPLDFGKFTSSEKSDAASMKSSRRSSRRMSF